MGKKLLGCGLAALAVAALPSSAAAGDTRCRGALAGTFDNVVVPKNADCVLTGSTVAGNVTVRRGASLFSESNDIAGNVEGDEPRFVGSRLDRIGGNFDVTGATGPGFVFLVFNVNVFVCGSTLTNGNIAVEKSRGGTVAVGTTTTPFCTGNQVAGNVMVQENLIPAFELMFVHLNNVGGDLQVFKNRGMGSKSVQFNNVRENVQCKENDVPFVGGPNFAQKAEEQCF
jgi:hypothetical protein